MKMSQKSKSAILNTRKVIWHANSDGLTGNYKRITREIIQGPLEKTTTK